MEPFCKFPLGWCQQVQRLLSLVETIPLDVVHMICEYTFIDWVLGPSTSNIDEYSTPALVCSPINDSVVVHLRFVILDQCVQVMHRHEVYFTSNTASAANLWKFKLEDVFVAADPVTFVQQIKRCHPTLAAAQDSLYFCGGTTEYGILIPSIQRFDLSTAKMDEK